MKKILVALLASIFIAAPVFAEENVVSIVNEDGKIVYNAADGFDERFMYHEGIVPGGETYTDYLTVRNDTSSNFIVYFKITTEGNTVKANELIDYINMKIYIDDAIFYDGKARGLDYRSQGVNLTDAVEIREFAAGDAVTMKIETSLDASYEDINNHDTSKTHWHFFILGDDVPEPDPEDPVEPEEVPPNPHTGDNHFPIFITLLIFSVTLLVILVIAELISKSKQRRS